jgi:2-oxoglutarate ferredoxin oxidoreductase subunit beta
MKRHPMLKYLKEEGPLGPRMPLIFCPGCGSGQVLNYTLLAVDRIIEEDKIRKEHFLFISGIGCSGRITSHYLNFDSAWTIHGRAFAVATGALLANPAFKIIVFTGDGDAASIGGNHFIHACRRNIDMTILCLNNGLYGMTGGQHAPTTPLGTVTTTTPYENREAAFDLCKLAEVAGATYVARWTTAHPRQVIKSIMRGLRKRGTAFIEILSQCPVHEKMSPTAILKRFRRNTIPISKAKDSTEGKTLIGEFCDLSRAEWNESYQEIIDQFLTENDKTNDYVMD